MCTLSNDGGAEVCSVCYTPRSDSDPGFVSGGGGAAPSAAARAVSGTCEVTLRSPDDVMNIVAELRAPAHTVTALVLTNIGLDDATALSFAPSFALFPALKDLDLSYNAALTDAGMRAVVDAVRTSCAGLRELYISHAPACTDVSAVCELLAGSSSLRRLQLGEQARVRVVFCR